MEAKSSVRPLNTNWHDSGIIDALKRLARDCKKADSMLSNHPWILNTCFQEAASIAGSEMRAASMKATFGTLLENFAVRVASHLMDPCDARDKCSNDNLQLLSQLYFDSCAVAVWTSAHVEYLLQLKSGLSDLPSPSIFSIPNSFSCPDLATLFEMRLHPKVCPKDSLCLLQMLSRCTNPGSRGWEPVVQSSLKSSISKRVMVNEFELCLCGMHPQLHPALRPSWKSRHLILKACSSLLHSDESNKLMEHCSLYLKEVVKRCVASVMSNMPAMHVSLSCLCHPVKHLCQPPTRLPNSSMEAAMAALAQSGEQLVSQTDCNEVRDLTTILDTNFRLAADCKHGLQWNVGWLGKGTVSVTSKTALATFATEVWSSSFKAPFLSLWVHAMTKDLRLTKLDSDQHAAIHEMTSATRLCMCLETEEQLRIQRLALFNPKSYLITVEDACREIGISVGDKRLLGSMNLKYLSETLRHMQSQMGSEAVAKLLVYARAAWVKEEIAMVAFDDDVSEMQCTALLRRLRQPVPNFATTDELKRHVHKVISVQQTCLCICTECQRVSNATVCTGVCDERKISEFNELGVSQTMIRWSQRNPEHRTCLRCAKRSSAALRNSQTFQEFMMKRQIEYDEIDTAKLETILTSSDKSSSGSNSQAGNSARIRRDSKNAMAQRAISSPCGSFNMLVISLIGHAVKVFGSFYAMCTVCSSVVKVQHLHKFAGKLCCLRCDHQMLFRDESLKRKMDDAQKSRAQKVCRFCGSVDAERTGVPWKRVVAPHDVAGENATLPPPLRTVYYCPSHYKSWIPQAHRVLQTRVILAHVASNAKPVFDVDTSTAEAQSTQEEHASQTPKRRRKNSAKSAAAAALPRAQP